MPFKPGQSGNPGGRPKTVAACLEKFRVQEDLDKLRDRLLHIALNGELRESVAAIKEWHDRAFGKAPQAITGADGGPIEITTDELHARLLGIGVEAGSEVDTGSTGETH